MYNSNCQDSDAGPLFFGPAFLTFGISRNKAPSRVDFIPGAVLADVLAKSNREGFCFMKTCENCGAQFNKGEREGFSHFEKRRFCSRECVRPKRKPDNELNPKTRYRTIKIKGKTYLVHRLVMQRKLGRELKPSEIVHHINHDRFDNDPDNLELTNSREHSIHHNQKHPVHKICEYCGTSYTPHKTKRERQKTCGESCRRSLQWLTRRGLKSPLVARRLLEGLQ